MRHLQAVCVARHQFLAEHFARFFRDAGVDVALAVGLDNADACVERLQPDIVVCDYELLMPLASTPRPSRAALQRAPVVAVSMTRTTAEMHQVAGNTPSAYWYLPTLRPAAASSQLYTIVAERARALAESGTTFSNVAFESR